jgi:trigger factor
MKVQVEAISPIEQKLSIEVEPERVSQELERAYSQLGRQVKIAGFRQGKVPRRILEQRYKEQVEDDVIQRVVQTAYFEAIGQHKVQAVSQPTVSNAALKPNEPFAFEARVQVKPVVEPKDYKGLSLKKTDVKVDDAKVNEQLERLRENASQLEPVTDRDVAHSGDFATIDYTASCEGKDFPGGRAENVTVEVAQGELVKGNIAALEGVKVGDAKDLDYAFPADYPVEEVKGKVAQFHLTLKGLKRKVVPALDDEFAKELGVGETLEDLKARVRADLERNVKQQAEVEEREALIKQLAEKNAFEVPKAMVDRAIDMMLRGALSAMAGRGIDPRSLNLDLSSLREDMRERALGEVRGTLLFEAIADKEKIEVSESEIDQRIEQMAKDEQVGLSQVKARFKGADQRRSLGLRMREEKTIEFLRQNASYS